MKQLDLISDTPLAPREARTKKTPSLPPMLGRAVFSDDMAHRYRLERIWDDARPPVAFCMLNPSTADAEVNDATIRRCIGFAQSWGHGGLIVGNIFAFRSTYPEDLRTAADPVGPENDAHLRAIAAAAGGKVVCAWGNHGAYRQRGAAVLALLRAAGATPTALRVSGSGQPVHPLYLPAGLTPQPLP